MLTDSICKHGQLQNVEVQAFPGIDVPHLGYLISEGSCQVAFYDVIIVHVGTNNVHKHSIYQVNCISRHFYISWGFTIKKHLVMSAIIPRPFDFMKSQDKVIIINKNLNKIVNKLTNVKYVKTYRRFIVL